MGQEGCPKRGLLDSSSWEAPSLGLRLWRGDAELVRVPDSPLTTQEPSKSRLSKLSLRVGFCFMFFFFFFDL